MNTCPNERKTESVISPCQISITFTIIESLSDMLKLAVVYHFLMYCSHRRMPANMWTDRSMSLGTSPMLTGRVSRELRDSLNGVVGSSHHRQVVTVFSKFLSVSLTRVCGCSGLKIVIRVTITNSSERAYLLPKMVRALRVHCIYIYAKKIFVHHS